MKIAIVNRHRRDTLGGSEIQCDLIARALTRRGHEVVYVAPKGSGTYDNLPYRVVPVDMEGGSIAKACLAENPHIMYWRFNKNSFRYVAKAMASHDIPLVFAVSHINDLQRWRVKPVGGRNPLRRLASRVRRMMIAAWNHTGFRWVAGIVCQTSEQYEAAPRLAMIVPNSSPSVESTEFVWPRPFAVWIGNIKPAKRPERCVAIARRLLPHGIDVVMVGRMQDSSYRWLEERTQVPENLHYIGVREIEAVNGILRQSLALLHSGMPEGFPNVFIQAWLHGKPTVSLECDPSGVIEKHGLGVVAHGSEELFHQAVCEVVTDETLARKLGANAARFAREHCDPSRNIDRLESLLIELSEQRRGSTKLTSSATEIAMLTTDRPRGTRAVDDGRK